jgi:hypothetical protein
MDQIEIVANQVEAQRFGYQAISLTHMTDGVAPEVAQGSMIEIGGALFEATGNDAIAGLAGIANSSAVYLKYAVTGTSAAASATIVAPTWDTNRQGWYDGDDRYFGGLYKDGSGNYIAKSVWPSNPNADPIGTIKMFDGLGWADNCTLPGWYACIAANAGQGCPDMVDKFIMGKVIAGAGVVGGETAKTIAATHLPKHSHDIREWQGVAGGVLGLGLAGATSWKWTSGYIGDGPGATNYLDISSGSYSMIFIRRCL